jgi:plasmid stability protein
MAQLLIRGLTPELIQRWKDRARRNNRSLEGEIRELLQRAIGPDPERYAQAVKFAEEMRAKYAGKITGNSADIIREAREERARGL